MTNSIPTALLDSLEQVKGFDKNNFIEAHHQPVCTSVRFNPNKKFDNDASALSLDAPVSWSSQGHYLKSRPSFTLDPIFHAGGYYVQEASSMFLEQAILQTVDLSKPLKVLDLCAAPGGKSTLIQSLITPDSLLVSNEVIKPRVNILIENISKWGAENVIVSNNDPAHFQRVPQYFDVIIADAPCSGSGLFRKEPEAIGEWSTNNVALCSQRQQRILHDVIPALKTNGILIYSTCSYSVEENEAISQWLKDEMKLTAHPIKIDDSWGIIETDNHNGYRFFPDKTAGEGFYLQVFKKPGDIVSYRSRKERLTPIKTHSFESPWIKPGTPNQFWTMQEDIRFANPLLIEELPILQANLYIKKAGVRIGNSIRGEHIPDHELAMCYSVLNKDTSSINVDYHEAINYLKRASLTLSESYKGWQLLKYNQLPLGFIKALPNRINNYYPTDWKILH